MASVSDATKSYQTDTVTSVSSVASKASALSYLKLPTSGCIVYVTVISRDTVEFLESHLTAHEVGMVILYEQESDFARTNEVNQELGRLKQALGIGVKQFTGLNQSSAWQVENFFDVVRMVKRSQNIEILGPLEHGTFTAISLYLYEVQNQYASLEDALKALEGADTQGLPDLEPYQKERLEELWNRFHSTQKLEAAPIAPPPRPLTTWEKIRNWCSCCCFTWCPSECCRPQVTREGYRAI